LVAVGEHHGVSDLHLVFYDGVDQSRVEGVNSEDAHPRIEPAYYVLVVVTAPVETAMDCDDARQRTVWRILRNEQRTENRVFGSPVQFA
jgi:hypothetical protein